MPNIILTDEELQEIDRLLAEFDPERHPETAPLLKRLSDETRATLVTWVREAQRSALEVAIPMRGVLERAEAGGVAPAQRESRTTMADGWINLLTTFDEIHSQK
jgi:hypothetical protein